MSGGPSNNDWANVGRPTSPPTGTGDGDGGLPPGGADPCDIVSLATLNSPVATVIRALKPGDVLDIHLNTGPPRILQARDRAGQVAGSITTADMTRLIACIMQGVVFVADVISVVGGACRVRVHR